MPDNPHKIFNYYLVFELMTLVMKMGSGSIESTLNLAFLFQVSKFHFFGNEGIGMALQKLGLFLLSRESASPVNGVEGVLWVH